MSDPGEQRSKLSGKAKDVVQARDIHGGVHFRGHDQGGGPVPKQLPGDVRDFINRSAELMLLTNYMVGQDSPEDGRAISVFVIVGTAGVGKTSLALHWAHRIRAQFPDGQLYVNLRGYDPGQPVTPQHALDRFLRVLNVTPDSIPADLDSCAELYRSLVADRRMLIVLDNAATVGQVRPLLPGTGTCLTLVTSRSRLSGLAVRNGARRLTVDTFTEQEAVTLLKVTTADHRAADDPAELADLARLCARLPLALRIAAERAASRPLMPLRELVENLRNESTLWDALTAGDEDTDTVRTVFAWSYRALSPDAARLFRLLGLHPGPEFGTSAAAALAGIGNGHVSRLLDILVGAHLIQQTATDRYQFHDLLRVYAVDQATSNENEDNRKTSLYRLLTWYLRAADAASTIIDSHFRRVPLPSPVDTTGDDSVVPVFADYNAAVDWYEQEALNLVSATRAAEKYDFYDIAWRLPIALRKIYAFRNPFEDWVVTATIGLAAARADGDKYGEAENLDSLGMAYAQSDRASEGLELHHVAAEIWCEIGDRFGEASAHNAIGLIHIRARRHAEARTHFEKCLDIVRQLGDRRWEGIALGNLGNTYRYLGQSSEAVDLVGQALVIHREVGNRLSEGSSLVVLSAVSQQLRRLPEALQYIREAIGIARELRNRAREGFELLQLGRIEIDAGAPEQALVTFQHAAVLLRQLNDRGREAQAFDGTGQAYQELGRFDEAADFHRRAVQVQRKLGDRWQLAIALDHLATALNQAGDHAAARPLWQEARSILTEFDSAAATEMRARIDAIAP